MKQRSQNLTRRTFLEQSATVAVTAGVGPMVLGPRVFGANDRIRAAVLGVHGQGNSHIEALMANANVEVTTLCDPDEEVSAKRASEFATKYGRKVKTVQDLRRVFDDKDIDVVTIATPNHWHALATIWACQAGKDVYVEKPGRTTSGKGAGWWKRRRSTTGLFSMGSS